MNQPFHSEAEVTENNTPPCASLWPLQQRLCQDQGGTIYPSQPTHPSLPSSAQTQNSINGHSPLRKTSAEGRLHQSHSCNSL